MSAIQVRNVAKVYRLYSTPGARLKEMISFGRRRCHQEFWALEGISFDVERGGAFGVIGPNGSGKSTLLEIITGTLEPTRGRVITRGRLAALLSLGAGFNPEFTGRENVFLNGEIMGLSRQEVQRNFASIERFAEIGEFIDRPVKTYSTGMYVRLAFSAAIHVDPEILVVDEVLAVGDAIFVSRCLRKLEELRARGVTVLLVTHDVALVKLLCTRAMLLYKGHVVTEGDPNDVVNRYNGLILEKQRAFDDNLPVASIAMEVEPVEPIQYSFRHGDGQAVVRKVELFNEDGHRALVFRSGEELRIRILVHFRESHQHPVVGVMIRTRIGMDVFGTNTELEDACPGAMSAGDLCEVNFALACWLTPQEYTLTVATQSADGTSHDWLDAVLSFQVIDSQRRAGVANLRARVTSRRLATSVPAVNV